MPEAFSAIHGMVEGDKGRPTICFAGGMAIRFVDMDRDTPLLLPVDLREWMTPTHSIWRQNGLLQDESMLGGRGTLLSRSNDAGFCRAQRET